MSTSVASAASPPRIDLKVLLLGTSTTEPDFQAWQSALQREGVKFDTLVGPTHAPITASTLSSTLSDGTLEAKYDAIIVSIGNLTDCSSGTCVSDLSSAETTALEQYEHKFNVRQVTGDVFPGTAYGMNTPAVSGALDGTSGTLTTSGQQVFPYLKSTAPIKMDTGTYGYEATPISTTNFDTLVSGPNGSALVGVYSHSDGVQEMVQTFNQNQYQLQSELLRHGAIAWATRGVYFGDQRNYLETHIDDNFLSDDAWSTTSHTTDFDPAHALREVPSDVTTAANWSRANNFRIDMLFNGAGSVAVANGSSLVGAGDSGSGTTGSTGGTGGSGSCSTANPCPDPLLAAFQSSDAAAGGKPFTQDFGWINHTWDHPNVDEGCATQKYIQAELNQNTNWGSTAAASGNPIKGGLGLASSVDPAAALGTENPNVVVTGEHSGLANLIPGNPGQVDPPSLNAANPASTTSATLTPGQYVYAISDQFNTAGPGAPATPGTGESAGSVSAPVTVGAAQNSVSLSWTAVCHAADYKIYRAPYTPPVAPSTTGTVGAWSLVGTVTADTAKDFTDPTSTTDTTGGGPVEKTFTDTGLTGTAAAPPTSSSANESAYEQNPALDAAFANTLSGGIKYFGADASKPYPNPANGTFATGAAPASQYTAGSTFPDSGGTGIPRYPTNIYYNVSTNAQEVDEYQTLYDLPTCKPVTGVTTCNPAGTAFTIDQIIASVDQGMFQHMMGNDPRPHYFHQTNLMSSTASGANGNGDGLFYETMNPLLAEYNQYFAGNAPVVQPTMAQIGALLSEQAAWSANTQVSGYIQGNQVTITNAAGAAAQVPLSGITTVGSPYGGSQSGWASVPGGTTTYSASVTWPVDTATVAFSPTSVVANGTSTSTATATVSADGKPVAGDPLTFTSSDPAQKLSAVKDNGNGTYSVTITSSTTPKPATITVTDPVVAPVATGQGTLNQTVGQVSAVSVSVSPGSIVGDGSAAATATARLTDPQGHLIPGEKLGFSSNDSGQKIGSVSDHGDGTYSATITSSTAAHVVTITATDSSVSPAVSGTASLTQTQKPSNPVPPSNPTPPQNTKPTPPVNHGAPSISGTLAVGRKLTTSPGSWSGTSPISFSYQWERCTRSCSPITGARGSSYTLAAADSHTRLMVMVSAANGAGAGHASSPQTGTVGASAPSAAQLKRLLTSLLAPSGKDATIAALLKHHGYSRSVTMPAAARVSVAWRLLGGKGRNTIVVASLTTRIRGAHRATIKVALTKQGQRLLAQGKRLRLSARGTLTVAGVAPITASKTIVIGPARH